MNKVYKTLQTQIDNTVNDLFGIKTEAKLEIPKDSSHGDVSTNVAMQLTKELKKAPQAIAEEIAANMSSDLIEKIEIKGPGFINFYFTNKVYNQIVEDILMVDEFIFDSGEKGYYNVEYVSANPTGDLHLGHARNAIFGDSVIRLLKKVGNRVDSEYYINDAGSQMDNLGLSVMYYYKEIFGIKMEFPEDGYRGEENQTTAQKIAEEFGDSKLDAPVEFFREYAYKRNLEEIKRILALLNVQMDIWTSERSFYEHDGVDRCIEELAKKGEVYEQDGAVWLQTSKYFDDKDRVLKRTGGQWTYFASDVYYQINKFQRGYSNLINIWGGDHHGYLNRVKSAVAAQGYPEDQFEVLFLQMINILQNNQRFKMSKRMGTSVTIKELLEEIDPESLRYFFVCRSNDTQIDFDVELAKKQNGDNPIFYIQYASTRINALLKKASEQGYEVDKNHQIQDFSELEKEIIVKLNNYEDVIISAANKRLPHLVCNYLYELANLYHRYYEQENVLKNKNGKINDKINISAAILAIIADGLKTIGIVPKKTMSQLEAGE